MRFYSLFSFLLLISFFVFAKEKTFEPYDKKVLRVCADANYLPFSNDKLEGFENKIASLLADELKAQKVEYVWHPLGVGFLRNTLQKNICDLVLGTTLKNGLLLNTNPYYQSSYALVYRKNENLNLQGLTDKTLQYLRIGVLSNTPPLSILVDLGFDNQLHYYPLLFDSRHASPSKDSINDLLSKKIDVAILWGPIAGYYVKKHSDKLAITALKEKSYLTKLQFKISMGVRNGEIEFKRIINRILRKNKPQIETILEQYGVPLL